MGCVDHTGTRVARVDYRTRNYGSPVVVRDLATGHALASFPGAYLGVAFHPDRFVVACSSRDGRIDVFDVESTARLARLEAHEGRVYGLAWSPDGKRLVSGGDDNLIRVWDGETYEPILELPFHRQYVHDVAFSADGTMLVSASADRFTCIWDSIPASERYAQVLENRRLEREVAGAVASWRRELGSLPEVRNAIVAHHANDPARRRAALKVLARMK